MFSKYAERYVLQSHPSGRYLGVNAQSQVIETLESPSLAWTFHTHDGAVRHARWIGEVHGDTPDVERLED